jgi:hypothetical protein
MGWFSVPVIFRVEAPTAAAAVLLVERERLSDLSEFLDYPDVSVTSLGVAPGKSSGFGLEMCLVEARFVLDAADAPEARAAVEEAVHELTIDEQLVHAIGEPVSTSDPRLLSRETKRALLYARDWLTDHLDVDAADVQAGCAFDDLVVVPEILPRCFSRYYTPELIYQIRAAIELVADKLAAYPDTYLVSSAEELAGHALIEEARAMLDNVEALTTDETEVARDELDELHDLAFEDHDVLMLFDPRLDGIESSDLVDRMGLANLHVRDWFKPFRSDAGDEQEP